MLFCKEIIRLLISLLFLSVISNFEIHAQGREDSIPVPNLPDKDSIIIKSKILSFKDTIFSPGGDTIILKKEVWVREKERLILFIDSIPSASTRILFARDSLITIKDTIVIVEDTLYGKGEKVILKIKQFSEKKNLFSRMLRRVLVFEKAKSLETIPPVTHSDKNYEAYEGKIIRSVEIRVLDVFGEKLTNPARKPKGFFEKAGNVLHIKSQKLIIRNKLLFEKGDTLNSLNLSESERLLRDNNYIYDARITVKDTTLKDSVDILVLAQDVWSISAGAESDPSASSYGVSLRDVNFLGLGQQLDAKVKSDPRLPNGYNLAGVYNINNLYKTYLTTRLYYRYEEGQTSYGAGVNREFFSPVIKWAGGANINWITLLYRTFDSTGAVMTTQPINFNQSEGWIGYGINISSKQSEYKNSRLIFAARIINTNYHRVPVVDDSVKLNLYDNNLVLSSVGINRRRYYKDSYIFRFGRTEDIPEGHQIALTAGLQNRKVLGPRTYYGINLIYSKYSKAYGYIYGRFALGSFFKDNSWEEGVMFTHILSFSPLVNLGNWKWRNFIGVRYVQGINQLPGSVIGVNQEQGLRGFSSNALRGTSKFVLNYESNFFPPIKFIGFRMAAVLFADMSWIGDKENLISKENFFPGFGIGLRIRNDHLIFNTIQILLGYYPKGHTIDAREFRFFETGRFYYNFYDFQFSRPSIIPYN